MISESVEELGWWQDTQPTREELHLSGGLLVEDWPHARQVMHLSSQVFAATCSLHNFDQQALRMLERAALLHNTGMLIEARRHHKHSFRLIKDAHLPDFTKEERYEIACIARYHRRALPSIEHEEYAALSRHARKRVSMLASFLRIADALDYSHDARVLRIAADPSLCNNNIWTMRLWIRSLSDLDTEIEHAYDKADLFEKVFKHKLRFIVQNGK
jgi:exopolyphosphatase/pppGpp-phosphohydrolase